MNLFHFYRISCVFLLISVGVTAPAAAQQLEEIVVTARKKEENLQDVPLSITAFSADAIRERGIVNVDELAKYTPGFSYNTGFGRGNLDRPTIRGLTTILNGLAGQKVAASFVDGVYMGGVISTIDFGSVERVEIIKGPQAAQYGRSTYGGAINYVTARPSDEFSGTVDLTVGQHETYEGRFRVSGPIAEDRAYFLLSGSHSEYGGEYTNIRTGEEVGDETSDNLLGKLYLTPTEDLEITLTLGFQETDDGHFVNTLQGREFNNCCFRTPAAPIAREFYVGTVNVDQPVNLFTDVLDLAGDGAGQRLERTYGSVKAELEFGQGTR